MTMYVTTQVMFYKAIQLLRYVYNYYQTDDKNMTKTSKTKNMRCVGIKNVSSISS